MRRQPEEFSFHAEKSTQHPGEEICIEGREEAGRNLLSFFLAYRPPGFPYANSLLDSHFIPPD
jgi:hypothetical protein